MNAEQGQISWLPCQGQADKFTRSPQSALKADVLLTYVGGAFSPTEDDPDAIFWQKLWTPVWAWIFDGCRMDQRTFDIVKNVGGWSHHDIQRKPGEGKTLFCHWSGVFTREAEDQD